VRARAFGLLAAALLLGTYMSDPYNFKDLLTSLIRTREHDL
jgi:hypothetical protein